MDDKSTLSYGTSMLTQEEKHAPIQWTIQHKDGDWSRNMKNATSCFAIPLVDGLEIQVLKSNEFRKTKRRLWCGEVSASRGSLVLIPLKQFWMALTSFKLISFLMQEDILIDDGDCNRITILNIKVDWLSNSCLVK